MAENVKEDNINSLCKKYFTPELCEDCITESKSTLERKLWVQMEKYGKKLSGEYSSITAEDCEDILIQTISECFKNWKNSAPSKSYTAYYATALSNNFRNENKKSEKKRIKEISLFAPIDETDDNTISDTIEDEDPANNVSAVSESVSEAKDRFSFIDYCFRIKKGKDWWKSILTCHFYEELHKLVSSYSGIRLNRYSFVDMDIYNWKEPPTQKSVAEHLGKDEGQLSTKLKVFLSFVKEQYGSE